MTNAEKFKEAVNYLLGEEFVKRMTGNILNSVKNAFLMFSTDPEYDEVEKEVYVTDVDYSMAVDIGATEDFMRNFIDDEEDKFIPSLYVVMNLIECTSLGASTFGLYDPEQLLSTSVLDKNGHLYSKTDAIIRSVDGFISTCPEDTKRTTAVKDMITNLFDLERYEDLETADISEADIARCSVTDIAFMLYILDLPIQSLFEYKFYAACERMFNSGIK